MPLTSRPRIAGNDNGESFCLVPDRSFQSIGLTLAAAASISTVLPLICGSGTLSSSLSFSGPPYSCSITAFIAYLPSQTFRHKSDEIIPRPTPSFQRSLAQLRRLHHAAG